MIQPGTLLKKQLSLRSDLALAIEDFAVRDGFGKIDQGATLCKLARRQALAKAEATATPFKEFPGTSENAPRGGGPGGQYRAGALTSVDVLAERGTHDPIRAEQLLREIIANTRRAQGLV